MLEAFPPRGIIRLLPPEHTSHGKAQIERLVAEEYILDTMTFFEGDRVQCAQRLASMPLCTCILPTFVSLIKYSCYSQILGLSRCGCNLLLNGEAGMKLVSSA